MRLAVIFILTLAAWNAQSAEYVIDTRGAHASIWFKVKHIGISWVTGEFRHFDGRFTWDPENPAASSVSVRIDPSSVDTNHAERDRHIRGADYLDVKNFPEAKFVSTRVVAKDQDTATIYGDLTLHGKTREIAIDASLVGKGKDPWGGYRAGFEGEAVIRPEEFGFAIPMTDTVHLLLLVEGVRQG